MLYSLHEYAYYSAAPMRALAQMTRDFWGSKANPASDTALGRTLYASAELFSNVTRRYGKPDWRIDSVTINDTPVRVQVIEDWSTPWVRLLRFQRDNADLRRAGVKKTAPAVLIVAPLSGHYATLLRGTVQEFLLDHDVYITDWVNARQVPVLEGRFDFYSYMDHIQHMLEFIGSRIHVVGVCQPGPPVLATACLMAEDNHPNRPASMTFMGSPIDARFNPTVTNNLAEERPFAWFKSNMVHNVPPPYPGVGRRVYPGFVQLYSFMSMNEERHMDALKSYFSNLVEDDGDGVEKHLEFYDEYLSVLDLTEEFYLQTIDLVFQKHALPKGELVHKGRNVKPQAITDIALMTVEGEKDDISGVGQTQAAHEICPNIPADMKELYVQAGAGHYGVFNGRRFRESIYPKIRDFIAKTDANL
ncbi:polyhydroxyalkanoate depolymerase [Asticcacaulis sp. ZE23SCel15]|uniref:polyhydroxyalkanoate depolymerase n=1 Tax=Asticcacaulis sp. ZE23SCel15 TaxID=3059027 RepID=UPI0026603A88|nr:polyhydroxyalkanoate depolymerase [Asticcacaulis sp. ZE23SCel15]WKL58170.1 polyhydroxyalkanoate depolymerase [Asticcacaulis sp. ZE23SCel15]